MILSDSESKKLIMVTLGVREGRGTGALGCVTQDRQLKICTVGNVIDAHAKGRRNRGQKDILDAVL